MRIFVGTDPNLVKAYIGIELGEKLPDFNDNLENLSPENMNNRLTLEQHYDPLEKRTVIAQFVWLDDTEALKGFNPESDWLEVIETEVKLVPDSIPRTRVIMVTVEGDDITRRKPAEKSSAM